MHAFSFGALTCVGHQWSWHATQVGSIVKCRVAQRIDEVDASNPFWYPLVIGEIWCLGEGLCGDTALTSDAYKIKAVRTGDWCQLCALVH